MTQFEYDQLMIVAGSFEMYSEGRSDEAKHAYRRCAKELREQVRSMKTEPADSVEGEPAQLPPMRWPSDRPTLSGVEET